MYYVERDKKCDCLPAEEVEVLAIEHLHKAVGNTGSFRNVFGLNLKFFQINLAGHFFEIHEITSNMQIYNILTLTLG